MYAKDGVLVRPVEVTWCGDPIVGGTNRCIESRSLVKELVRMSWHNLDRILCVEYENIPLLRLRSSTLLSTTRGDF
jgi:hypothetical protein